MNIIKGCAIDYTLAGKGKRVLLHVCNDKGVMGAGIAKQVKERISTAYRNYKLSGYRLGEFSHDDRNLVINLHAQKGYGRDGKRYLDYGALVKSLSEVPERRNELHWLGYNPFEYVIPYGMGAGLAGGDWRTVYEICCGVLGGENITVLKKD